MMLIIVMMVMMMILIWVMMLMIIMPMMLILVMMLMTVMTNLMRFLSLISHYLTRSKSNHEVPYGSHDWYASSPALAMLLSQLLAQPLSVVLVSLSAHERRCEPEAIAVAQQQLLSIPNSAYKH